jgi:hypothetical protein
VFLANCRSPGVGGRLSAIDRMRGVTREAGVYLLLETRFCRNSILRDQFQPRSPTRLWHSRASASWAGGCKSDRRNDPHHLLNPQ